jgi:hypothetical protein
MSTLNLGLIGAKFMSKARGDACMHLAAFLIPRFGPF